MTIHRSYAAVIVFAITVLASGSPWPPRVSAAPAAAFILDGTIVTMNAARDILQDGHILVRDGRIAAIWQGSRVPESVDVAGAQRVPLGQHAYIYPGLINLHDHPFYDMLPL